MPDINIKGEMPQMPDFQVFAPPSKKTTNLLFGTNESIRLGLNERAKTVAGKVLNDPDKLGLADEISITMSSVVIPLKNADGRTTVVALDINDSAQQLFGTDKAQKSLYKKAAYAVNAAKNDLKLKEKALETLKEKYRNLAGQIGIPSREEAENLETLSDKSLEKALVGASAKQKSQIKVFRQVSQKIGTALKQQKKAQERYDDACRDIYDLINGVIQPKIAPAKNNSDQGQKNPLVRGRVVSISSKTSSPQAASTELRETPPISAPIVTRKINISELTEENIAEERVREIVDELTTKIADHVAGERAQERKAALLSLKRFKNKEVSEAASVVLKSYDVMTAQAVKQEKVFFEQIKWWPAEKDILIDQLRELNRIAIEGPKDIQKAEAALQEVLINHITKPHVAHVSKRSRLTEALQIGRQIMGSITSRANKALSYLAGEQPTEKHLDATLLVLEDIAEKSENQEVKDILQKSRGLSLGKRETAYIGAFALLFTGYFLMRSAGLPVSTIFTDPKGVFDTFAGAATMALGEVANRVTGGLGDLTAIGTSERALPNVPEGIIDLVNQTPVSQEIVVAARKLVDVATQPPNPLLGKLAKIPEGTGPLTEAGLMEKGLTLVGAAKEQGYLALSAAAAYFPEVQVPSLLSGTLGRMTTAVGGLFQTAQSKEGDEAIAVNKQLQSNQQFRNLSNPFTPKRLKELVTNTEPILQNMGPEEFLQGTKQLTDNPSQVSAVLSEVMPNLTEEAHRSTVEQVQTTLETVASLDSDQAYKLLQEANEAAERLKNRKYRNNASETQTSSINKQISLIALVVCIAVVGRYALRESDLDVKVGEDLEKEKLTPADAQTRLNNFMSIVDLERLRRTFRQLTGKVESRKPPEESIRQVYMHILEDQLLGLHESRINEAESLESKASSSLAVLNQVDAKETDKTEANEELQEALHGLKWVADSKKDWLKEVQPLKKELKEMEAPTSKSLGAAASPVSESEPALNLQDVLEKIRILKKNHGTGKAKTIDKENPKFKELSELVSLGMGLEAQLMISKRKPVS